MAVYGYIRVSTTRQVSEGESLNVQRRMLEGYVLMHGLQLEEVLVEEGVSGSIPLKDRPAGSRLLSILKPGDVVVAAKLDRCFRSAQDALNVVAQLRARKVRLHLLDLGGDVTGNGLSKLFLTMAAAFAEAEHDRIRERVSNVKTDQKNRGRYLGGKIPFGYRVDPEGNLVEDEKQQEAMYQMSLMMEEGTPLRKIAASMEQRGHKVSHETVRRNHRWTQGDDIVAYYLCRYGEEGLSMSKDDIADELGMPRSSLAMRVGNFQYIVQGSGGLSHPAKQSREVYEEVKSLSESELREVALKAIRKS